jgi:hypothetical protein
LPPPVRAHGKDERIPVKEFGRVATPMRRRPAVQLEPRLRVDERFSLKTAPIPL